MLHPVSTVLFLPVQLGVHNSPNESLVLIITFTAGEGHDITEVRYFKAHGKIGFQNTRIPDDVHVIPVKSIFPVAHQAFMREHFANSFTKHGLFCANKHIESDPDTVNLRKGQAVDPFYPPAQISLARNLYRLFQMFVCHIHSPFALPSVDISVDIGSVAQPVLYEATNRKHCYVIIMPLCLISPQVSRMCAFLLHPFRYFVLDNVPIHCTMDNDIKGIIIRWRSS